MNAKHSYQLLALSLALASNLALAHAGHDHNGHAEQPPAARQEKTSVRFADVSLLNQDACRCAWRRTWSVTTWWS